MKQKIFIDTEFTDFIGSELISLGAVSDDGQHEFYVEITDYNRKLESGFVKENIIPLLDTQKYGMTYQKASLALFRWIESLPFDKIEIAADYPTDWDLFHGLLFESLPEKVDPEFFNALTDVRVRASMKDLGIQPGLSDVAMGYTQGATLLIFRSSQNLYFSSNDVARHHALHDAKALRQAWNAANTYLTK
jgi:hypothetical protein